MLKDLLKDHEIILASGSPRRQNFFKELGIPFTIDVRPVNEIYPEYLPPKEIAEYLAKLKADSFKKDLSERQILITGDTIVFNGEILGKPASAVEAKKMIRSLSGKAHQVITAVCLTGKHHQKVFSDVTKVHFRELSDTEIDFYVEQYKPFDKAGAYAIQEWIGLVGIEKIEGSYFNVVGLPTHLLYREILNFIE